MSIPPKPLFRVTPCCVENGTSAEINLDGILASGTGVYTYNGASDLPIPGTDVTLVPGECYYIIPLGTLDIVTEVPLADLTFVDSNRCEEVSGCPTCDSPGTFYIKAEPCCGGDPIFFKGEGYEGGTVTEQKEPTSGSLSGQWQATSPSIPQFSILNFSGVYLFDGPTEVEGLTIGQCYTFSYNTVEDVSSEVTPAEYLALEYPPYLSELSFISKNDCDADANGDGQKDCPTCEEVCYRLTSCTGITINTIADLSAYVGTYIEINELPGTFLVQVNEGLCENAIPVITYSGPAAEDCPCICYEVLNYKGAVSYIDCDGVSQVTYAPAKFCAVAPPLIKGREGIDYTLITGTDCIDGECPEKCFLLTNCDPTAYPEQDATLNSTVQSLSQYANTDEVVVLSGYDGCWTVEDYSCNCIEVTIDSSINPGANTYTANQQGQYNGSNYYTFTWTEVATEYNIWFDSATGSWVISSVLGVRGLPGGELVDSKAPNPPCPVGLTWTVTGVLPVTSLTTELCDEQCDCPVDVTVIRDYKDCQDCLGITAYKLSNCEKINEVVYSTQDLSAYVGKVLKDDCACWTVEEIDYQPPSEATIVDPILYTDCTSCLTTYYVLTDCDGAVDPIITSSNLSAYIGQVIKIQGCTECYTVSEYSDPSEPSNWQEVTLVQAFVDCPTCKELNPRCSTVFNNSTQDRTFTYIDANGDSQETDLVKSGSFSLRYCVQYWDEPDTFIYNYYGDCTVYEDESGTKTGFCVQYFPNNRKVKPGYNTPICSADKYDKITCNFADIAYKKVLELRYGISNCCPEEDEKWLIKKELIELQALTDPDYTCDPVTDCCGKQTSHCSCNS